MNQKPTNPNQSSFRAHGSAIGRQLIGKSARIILAIVLAGTCAGTALAQGDIPSGSYTSSGSGPYTYDLTFKDSASATAAIGSVWYAWIPFQNNLPGSPTSALAPFGWTESISGGSIMFTASSSVYDIQPGQSLSGFSFTASFAPSSLTPSTQESDAYLAGIEGDPGVVFTVTPGTVPEPSAAALFGISALGLGLSRWRRLRAKA